MCQWRISLCQSHVWCIPLVSKTGKWFPTTHQTQHHTLAPFVPHSCTRCTKLTHPLYVQTFGALTSQGKVKGYTTKGLAPHTQPDMTLTDYPYPITQSPHWSKYRGYATGGRQTEVTNIKYRHQSNRRRTTPFDFTCVLAEMFRSAIKHVITVLADTDSQIWNPMRT